MTAPAPCTSRSRVARYLGVILFVAALCAYLYTLAPGLVRGDGGELQFILATLGVAHPTGYPLYSILGWLWAHLLPFGSVAWRINLISAVCGAAAVALVYGIVYRLTHRVLPALAGAAFLAFSPAFWVLSSVTEVYALHALFVALVLYLLLVWRDAGPRRPRVLLLVAFVYGLSLSHHRTMILLAPAIALFVILELLSTSPSGSPASPSPRHSERSEESRRSEESPAGPRLFASFRLPHPLRNALLLAAAFTAGLLPYAHVFIQQLRRGQTVHHVIFNVILGGDFAGFLGLRSDPGRILWTLPRQEIGLLGLALALAGLAWLAWRQRTAACLLAVALAANLAFCLIYRVPDIEDFTLPTTLLLSILAGASAGWLSHLHPFPSPLQGEGQPPHTKAVPPSPSERDPLDGEGTRRGRGEGGAAPPSHPEPGATAFPRRLGQRTIRSIRSRNPLTAIYRADLSSRNLQLLTFNLQLLLLLLAALLSVRHLPAVQAGVAARDGGVEDQARALLAYTFEPDSTALVDWDVSMAVRFLRAVEGAPQNVRVNAARLGRERACSLLQEALAAGKPLYIVSPVRVTRLPDGYAFSDAPPYLKIERGEAPYTTLDRPLDSRLTLQGLTRQGRLLVLRWQVAGSPLPEDYTTYVHYFDAAGQALGQQDKGMGSELSCWFRPTSWTPGQVIQDLYLLPSGTTSVRIGFYGWHEGQIQPQGTDTSIVLP